jgi:RNA polymerase sigma factor (TIGR02999 family)
MKSEDPGKWGGSQAMADAEQGHVTQMLIAAAEGDSEAAADILPLVYGELRRLAEARMTAVPPGQTLQATALVHEAYLRLLGNGDPGWRSRGHFFFAAARAIHDILVEQARRKARLKRGGDRRRVSGRDLEVTVAAPSEDVLALSECLKRLEREDATQHQLVMLRFFAGLTAEQTAEVMGISRSTLQREWRFVRAQLRRDLGEGTTGKLGDDDEA